jgi:uncharacterized protein (DUF302 family)
VPFHVHRRGEIWYAVETRQHPRDADKASPRFSHSGKEQDMSGTEEMIELISPVAFAPTLERLINAIHAAGLTLFFRFDHAANAQEVGLSMPPTTVLVYGHAKGGTPVMLAAPLAALDLPLRVLVREREDGRIAVAFHPAAAMLRRAGVPEALATRLDPAEQILAAALSA